MTMTSSVLPRRTYSIPSGHRGPPSPTLDDTSFTPAEELSSWLPDDLCAACGAQARPSHLYCSEECRRKDQEGHRHDSETSTSLAVSSTSAPPSAKLKASTRHYFISTTAADIDSLQRFRYPLPPSPLLFAQRTTLAENSGKSGPALITLSSHRSQQPRKTSTASSNGEWSRERPRTTRRTSADSSESSQASSSAFLTDPSTPSPEVGNRGCDSAIEDGGSIGDDDELNSSDFRLPPSVSPAGAVMLSHGHHTLYHDHHRSRCDRQVSPLQSQSHLRQSRSSVSGTGDSIVGLETSPTMSFARRPGSTNVPTPVLYSPVLVARATDSDAQATTIRSHSSKARPHFANDDGDGGLPLLHMTRGSSVSAACETVKRRGGSSPDTRIDLRMLRARSDPSQLQLNADGQLSPHQHDSGGSGSSSAARTARATSPASLASSGEFCGRPGCSGTSLFRGVPFSFGLKGREPAPQHEGRSEIRALPSQPPIRDGESVSPLFMPRHKHTHSAKAGLTIHQHLNTPAPGSLIMTPAHPRQAVSAAPHEARQAQEKAASEEQAVAAEQPHSHPRGRSTARGRRSTSRRSRSPPRAAARGRSVALQSEERQRKAVNSNSPPLEAVRPRSDPIDIDLPSRRPTTGDELGFSSLSEEEDHTAVSMRRGINDDDADDDESRRGRSPAERSRRESNVRGPRSSPPARIVSVLTDAVRGRRSFGGREEHSLPGNKGSIDSHPSSHPRFNVDPGFDDVEDLDLEA